MPEAGGGYRMAVRRDWRTRALVLIFSGLIAVTVFLIWSFSTAELNRDVEATRSAEAILRARLDRETGLRGYLNTRSPEFLEPYEAGRTGYLRAINAVRDHAGEDEEVARLLRRQDELSRAWDTSAETSIAHVRRADRGLRVGDARSRKLMMDEMRALNARLVKHLDDERTADESFVTELTILAIAFITLIGLVLGYLLVDRPARRRAVHAAEQREFGDSLQMADNEEEAYGLLARQLARTVEGGRAVVLNRNNSADRLEAATPLSTDSPIGSRLVGATPRSCLAVRKGSTHVQSGSREALMQCEICGGLDRSTMCVPSLIAGEVIGSSLVAKAAGGFSEEERTHVQAAVSQAAPVLANLRNLRLAERRAATDALTGLANNRATQDNLKRLLAIAHRTGRPLTVILLDLDHFKSINDTFGHPVGDDVLEAVGAVLTSNVRASDFAGRYGGEEFVVLLPETDAEGATTVAEKMRHALTMLHVPVYTGRVTASFGVAAYPEHGADPDLLLAAADEALYRAKADGRNLVRVAEAREEGVRPEAVQPDEARTRD